MIDATPIGVVETDADAPDPPADRRERETTVVVDTEYEEGLHRIEENDYLVVVFHLHESDGYTLRGDRRYGSERGVFNSRSPNRPGKTGVTTVELLERDGRRLRVRGLDAIGGTPVLDVKPYVPGLDSPPTVDESDLAADPRAGVDLDVRQRDLGPLFVDAAALHGRYCPMLAAGVLVATYAARDLGGRTTRGLVAAVETDGCLLDAVQYVLGATVGNGRLQWRATDAPVVTVAGGDDALRIELLPEAIREQVDGVDLQCTVGREDTGRDAASDDAFDLLRRPEEDVATIESVDGLPDWTG